MALLVPALTCWKEYEISPKSMLSVCHSELLNPESYQAVQAQLMPLSTWVLCVRALCAWSGSQKVPPSSVHRDPFTAAWREREGNEALLDPESLGECPSLISILWPPELLHLLSDTFFFNLCLSYLSLSFSPPPSLCPSFPPSLPFKEFKS